MSMVMWNEVLQWAVLLLLVFMGVGLLIMVADIQRRLGPDLGAPIPQSGLAVGALAPDFVAEDRRTGKCVAVSDYVGRRLLVAFMSPRCEPCKELLPSLNRFALERRGVPVIVVAPEDAGIEYARQFAESIVVVGDTGKAIELAYDVGWTPLVFLLDEERRVLNRTVSNSLIDLEDTLDGKGRPQSAAWVPTTTVDVASPDGVDREGLSAPDRSKNMVTLAEKTVNFLEKRLSRRGFLAFAGRVAAATGMVLVGADRLALTVGAQTGCCIQTPRCTGCPPPSAVVCASGCAGTGTVFFCCDTGGSNTCHSCVECSCPLIGLCWCEHDLGSSCASPPCI
jgi:thiol-disulfide isomerase/thioredoxin